MSVCNVEAIAQSFNVEQCYSGNPDAALWVDFGRRSDTNDTRPYSLKTTLVSRAETLQVGDDTRDRRVPGADPPDQHPLDVRPRTPRPCSPRIVSRINGATARTGRGRSRRRRATPPPATSAASCSTPAIGGSKAARPPSCAASSAPSSKNIRSRPSRPVTAACCAAARWSSGNTRCSTRFWRSSTAAWSSPRYVDRDELR